MPVSANHARMVGPVPQLSLRVSSVDVHQASMVTCVNRRLMLALETHATTGASAKCLNMVDSGMSLLTTAGLYQICSKKLSYSKAKL